MESSTQPSTRRTQPQSLGYEELPFESEGSESEHSFAGEPRSHKKKHLYLSTTLVTQANITLADVMVEESGRTAIRERLRRIEAASKRKRNPYGIVDPRSELKARQRESDVVTMVDDEEVVALSEAARRVMERSEERLRQRSRDAPAAVDALIRRLRERVRHDHMRHAEAAPEHEEAKVDPSLYAGKPRRRDLKARRKVEQQAKLDEARRLLLDEKVPLCAVKRRLKLSHRVLTRVRDKGLRSAELLTRRSARSPRFGKFHLRAVELLQEMLAVTDHPLSLREMQAELSQRVGLRVSRPWLGRFLRERLGSTYRQVKAISKLHNAPQALLQRQFAAARFIEALDRGMRIISVDESVVRWTDHRKRGWLPRACSNQVTGRQKLQQIAFIAAMCSSGEVWFTVNCGMTNSETFCLFLAKLVEHLDGVDRDWRENSVVLLDNANYHRGIATQTLMASLRLPVLFLGPYHFNLSPVELLFNCVKARDLNPLRSKVVAW